MTLGEVGAGVSSRRERITTEVTDGSDSSRRSACEPVLPVAPVRMIFITDKLSGVWRKESEWKGSDCAE